MPQPIQNINIKSKTVLVAPLDWGLGHATRCIAIINELVGQGFNVLLASEKSGAALLQQEFPYLKMLSLKGYNVSYSKQPGLFFIKMLGQFFKILRTVKEEKKWLEEIIKEHKIDVVISDNRYGLSNTNCYCIFLTHQLYIKTGNRFTEWLAQKINYYYINNFDECWVPDLEGFDNLAGKLSHPLKMPLTPVKYTGILSRFTNIISDNKIDLLIVLSGPEPQRTVLEDILLKQIAHTKYKTVFVRGLPLAKNKLFLANNLVTFINYVQAKELNAFISSSKFIVARSGYSTVMDIAVLQRASLLIPTPGQTEQEYLAKYLASKHYCITAIQKNLDLNKEIEKLNMTALQKFPITHKGVLKAIINQLK